MSIDAIGTNINSSNYAIKNNTQKTASADDETSDTSERQGTSANSGVDTFVKSTAQDTVNSTYQPVKNKLSPEEVKALEDEQASIKADLIKTFVNDTINNQNKLLGKSTNSGTGELSKGSSDLLTKIFGSVENAYPPLATTTEGAQQAIAEGGAYSVTAVADRIMTMAQALAGNDPDKLQQMRDAVEKGFSEAGLDFKNATNSDLPQISKDTMAEVMQRFDALQGKTTATE